MDILLQQKNGVSHGMTSMSAYMAPMPLLREVGAIGIPSISALP